MKRSSGVEQLCSRLASLSSRTLPVIVLTSLRFQRQRHHRVCTHLENLPNLDRGQHPIFIVLKTSLLKDTTFPSSATAFFMFSGIHCTGQFADERESVVYHAGAQPVVHEVREIDKKGIVQIVLQVSLASSDGWVS